MRQFEYYKQEWFQRDIDFLVDKINYQKYSPDIIVGVVRGGLVPAVYLSHRLGANMVTVNWSFRDNNIAESHLERLTANNVRNILVVDDICDSGKTLSLLIEDLVSSTGAKIKTATLWFNTRQPFIVDYYANTIDRKDDHRFILFPWEQVS